MCESGWVNVCVCACVCDTHLPSVWILLLPDWWLLFAGFLNFAQTPGRPAEKVQGHTEFSRYELMKCLWHRLGFTSVIHCLWFWALFQSKQHNHSDTTMILTKYIFYNPLVERNYCKWDWDVVTRGILPGCRVNQVFMCLRVQQSIHSSRSTG